MRTLILSVFVGLCTGFVAWAASFALIEIAALDTTALREHQLVVGVAAALVAVTLVILRSTLDPIVTIGGNAAACAALWETRSFPAPSGYSPEYWSALVVTSLVFMTLVVVLNSQLFFRRRD